METGDVFTVLVYGGFIFTNFWEARTCIYLQCLFT